MSTKNTILFDISKNEVFQLSDNFKTFHRKLMSTFKIEICDSKITTEKLKRVSGLILAAPQSRFLDEEIKSIWDYIDVGGKLWVMSAEGGDLQLNNNCNAILEKFGTFTCNDNVIRSHYYKNFHPKEATVAGGVVCESMWRHLITQNIDKIDYDFTDEKHQILFQYPYGATLKVSDPSVVLLTTGPAVYPFNRPLCSYFVNENNGKVLSLGSGHMFEDKYISNRTNEQILQYIVHLLFNDDIRFSHLDFNDIEINDNTFIGDISYIAELPKPSLVHSIGGEIPMDFKKMFDMTLNSLSNLILKDIIEAYKVLRVKYEPLKITKPEFEIPLPSLQLAIFPPIFSEPPPPPLELYDLDEVFSTQDKQLLQITSKYTNVVRNKGDQTQVNEKELQHFIRDCAEVAGVQLDDYRTNGKSVINTVALRIANFRKYSE